jgi:hypothetical protein
MKPPRTRVLTSRPHPRFNRHVRILIAGQRSWNCHKLAEAILRRLQARYGSDIVVALGGSPGVDWAFCTACERLGIAKDVYLADFSHVGDYSFGNAELVRRGVGLCLILHRRVLDKASQDLMEKAIMAEIPTWLIDSEEGRPRRLGAGMIE